MDHNEPKPDKKQKYEPPCVLASYEKEELEELIRPEGLLFQDPECSPGGCGCGC